MREFGIGDKQGHWTSRRIHSQHSSEKEGEGLFQSEGKHLNVQG